MGRVDSSVRWLSVRILWLQRLRWVVCAAARAGISRQMRTFLGWGSATALAIVVMWRGVSEVLDERARLLASGELDRRLHARRLSKFRRAGLSEPQLTRVHAAVHVGAVVGVDVDDIGLLEGAMRRSTRPARHTPGSRAAVPAVTKSASPTATPRGTGSAYDIRVALQAEDVDDASPRETTPPWTIVAAIVAVGLTVAPLVRPLGDASPWIALAGVSLAAIAWITARRESDS